MCADCRQILSNAVWFEAFYPSHVKLQYFCLLAYIGMQRNNFETLRLWTLCPFRLRNLNITSILTYLILKYLTGYFLPNQLAFLCQSIYFIKFCLKVNISYLSYPENFGNYLVCYYEYTTLEKLIITKAIAITDCFCKTITTFSAEKSRSDRGKM